MRTSNLTHLALAIGTVGAVVLSLASSSGIASVRGLAYTGAPSAGGGQEQTCNLCHNSGTQYGEPVIAISVSESEGGPAVNAYTPGQEYFVSVNVSAEADPAGYGFQSVFLQEGTDGGPLLSAGTLARNTANAFTQISTIGTGENSRDYAEQNQITPGGTFDYLWTAPGTGSGAVSIYTVGNAVNGANGTGGDFGSTAPTILELPEAGALPLALTRFNASSNGKQILLSWASDNEVGFDRFVVERGAGQDWRTIGTVNGTNARSATYDFVDNEPTAGTNAYRLRMLDLDGSHTYSPVATANARGFDWSVYPNPVAEELRLTTPAEAGATARIYDGFGRLLLTADPRQGISVATLSPGTYTISIGASSRRFIKQ